MPSKNCSNQSTTPPTQKHKEKEGDEDEDEECHCDRCTEKVEDLVQCERCEMWLCAECEKISLESIHFIGKFSEF